MDLPEKNCPELTQQTADAIDDESLHQLFVSTQKNNLDLCVKAAIQFGSYLKQFFHMLTILRTVMNDFSDSSWEDIALIVLSKFPHYWVCGMTY